MENLISKSIFQWIALYIGAPNMSLCTSFVMLENNNEIDSRVHNESLSVNHNYLLIAYRMPFVVS